MLPFSMFRPRPILPRANRSTTATLVFRMSSSYFNLQVSTFNSVSLTPFPATPTNTLQTTEKTATLSLLSATLTRHITPNSFVCHSYKKHPASNLSSQRSFRSSFPPPNFLPTRHSPLATKSFGIRTYEKLTRNPFRIRTSETQDLKPFGMNTYKKSPGGGLSGNCANHSQTFD